MRGASAPDLLHLQAAADRDVADADDRRALRRRDRRGLRLAAFELHDVGVDAALLEIAQRLRHIGRGVHDVRRRHRHADVDLAHGRAVRPLAPTAACATRPRLPPQLPAAPTFRRWNFVMACSFLVLTIVVALFNPSWLAAVHGATSLLRQPQQRRQRDAEQAERHDRHEHLVDLERARRAHDQIADAGDRGVEVGQHHADHAAADREPDAGDDERQRAGQHDVGPQLPLRAAERAADLEQLRVHRLHALIGVDHHREEREQEQDDDLGGGLVAGPQHDQRHQRHRRDRIEEGDVDGERRRRECGSAPAPARAACRR